MRTSILLEFRCKNIKLFELQDSWEDEEEEKKDVEKKDDAKAKAKPKKALADKIAEKEVNNI